MLNLGLGFLITAKDLASGAFERLERNFMSLDKRVGLGTERIKSSFRQIGLALAVFSAGAVGLGGAFALAEQAGQFEQAVAAVAAVSGATRTELDALRAAAIDAGIATQFSPTEATVGLKELSQAGYNATESIKLLIPVLDLAGGSLGELSPAQAAGLASQALKAFGLSADEAAGAVDRMLQAVNVFALNASELPAALGIASRGAQTLNQSMSETLIALGLVKNIIPGLERASTGVAVAMERLADERVQKALEGMNVEVTDAEGGFRNFLDVLGDMAPELNKMTEARRAGFLIDTFGAHALGSIQAILTQVTNGIRTNTGATVQGAEAIAYLRQQFESAGGTAAGFREKMLDTFAGQKQLLGGSLQTLAILLGQPFAAVLKPIVSAVVEALNRLLVFIRALPASVKTGFAAVFVGASAVLSLVGAAIAAKASLALLVLGLKALGITLGGVLLVFAPAVLIAGGLTLAVAGLRRAFQHNVGGIADSAARASARVKLAFDGLKQLFEDGGFSGAVREELGRTENGGLKSFLVNVYLWGSRLRNLLAGAGRGFSSGIELARPSITALVASLEQLGEAFGFLGDREGPGAAAAQFERFGSTGERVGLGLARAFELLVQGARALVDIGRGLVAAWSEIRPALGAVGDAFTMLGRKLGGLLGSLSGADGAATSSGDTWVSVGRVIGVAVALIVEAIAFFVAAVGAAVGVVDGALGAITSLFSGLADVVTGVVFLLGGIFSGSWTEVWTGMKLVAFGVIDAIAGAVLQLVGAIGGAIDAVASLFGASTNIQKAVQGFQTEARAETARTFGVEQLSFRPVSAAPAAPARSPSTAPAMPAVAALRAPAPNAAPSASRGPNAPVVVNVQVDGQTIARAMHKADDEAAARGFSPVPVY